MPTRDARAGVLAPPLRCDLLGARVDVAAPDGEPLRWIRLALSGFLTADDIGPAIGRFILSPRDAGGWALARDGAMLRTDADLATAVLALEWHLVTDAIARRPDLFHLHGAALATPDGAATLLIVGDSGSGKTTLALGLMAEGFRPFGDDVTFIQPSPLSLLPLRRAFHVRAPTRQLLPLTGLDAPWTDAEGTRWFLPPRWAALPSPPVRAILFPVVRPGVAPSLALLAPAEGAQCLLRHTVTLESSPALALSVVGALTARANCYRLIVGDVAGTVGRVRTLVRRESGR